MLLLSRPVSAGEYKEVWRYLSERFAWVGTEAKDAARQWYLGCACKDGSYDFVDLDGEAIDVDGILESGDYRDDDGGRGDFDTVACESTWTTERSIERAAEIIAPLFIDEKRHAISMALAGACAHDGISEDASIELLCRVASLGPMGDEQRDKRKNQVRDARERFAQHEPVYGWPKVRELLGRARADLARDELHGIADMKDEFSAYLSRRENRNEEDGPANDVVPPGRGQSAAARALQLGSPIARMSTPFATLDKITRGGLPVGKTVVIGGAPGAGKTATVVQLAFHYVSQGVHVGILAADEEADGLLVRLGQLAGFDRDDLENGEPEARAKLAAWCESVPLHLFDQDEDGVTVEEASARLKDAANGAPSVFIVDSVQTARTTTGHIEIIRERIDDVVRALKSAAKVDGHLVAATSELARASYRNQDGAANIDDLAAFKESGGIEYGFGLALVLRSRKGSAELVDVSIAKNRFGGAKTAFVLRLDFERAGVIEYGLATLTLPETPEARMRRQLLELADPEYLLSPTSKSTLVGRVTGNKAKKLKILNDLIDDGHFVEDTGLVRQRLPSDPPMVIRDRA